MPLRLTQEELNKLLGKKPGQKESKYHSQKITVGGRSFDSIKEANRYSELVLAQRSGEISELRFQVPYLLIPSQKDEKGKTIERPVKYVADFVYKDKNGSVVVEDTKGVRTADYIIKRKLMLYIHKIRIKEI